MGFDQLYLIVYMHGVLNSLSTCLYVYSDASLLSTNGRTNHGGISDSHYTSS